MNASVCLFATSNSDVRFGNELNATSGSALNGVFGVPDRAVARYMRPGIRILDFAPALQLFNGLPSRILFDGLSDDSVVDIQRDPEQPGIFLQLPRMDVLVADTFGNKIGEAGASVTVSLRLDNVTADA